MKSPAPDNTWAPIKMSESLLNGALGGEGGVSGAMLLEGQEMLVHCGGWDESTNQPSTNCFSLHMDSSEELVVDRPSPLPEGRNLACHGSDGGWLAVAGGQGSTGEPQQDVWVLDDVASTWRSADVELNTAR